MDLTNLFQISMTIDLNLMTIDLNSMITHRNQLQLTDYRNECKIVYGGNCFDQFASDFDDHSLKSVAI